LKTFRFLTVHRASDNPGARSLFSGTLPLI
jgi:hypothetical protein